MADPEIITNNSGRIVLPGVSLPDGIDLESTIILETDGGAVQRRDGRFVGATWKVICGEDIARLPADVTSNLAYGPTGDPDAAFYVEDRDGTLRLYVPNDGKDMEAVLYGAAENGMSLIGSNASLRRTIDIDGLIIRRAPDFQDDMVPKELSKALHQVCEMREDLDARCWISSHPDQDGMDF